jgi:ABC-type phosphate transport system substrate-binding protein
MKFKLTALAAALVVAGSANAAMDPAHQLILHDGTNTGALDLNHVISISGASAVQKGFATLVADLFTGTPIYFSNKGTGSGVNFDKADFIAVAGTLAAGNGAWSNSKAVVLYRVQGGSIYGVNSVARQEPIEAIDVVAPDLANSIAGCGAVSGDGSSAIPYDCGTKNIVPDAGVSDVNPKLFKAPYNTEGEVNKSALSAAELAVLSTQVPLYGIAFGIPVTKNVAANTVFNRATIAAIMSGGAKTWAKVNGDPGPILICRRTPGSGTQAVYNLWAGNYPCAGNALTPLDRDGGNAPAAQYDGNGALTGYLVDGNATDVQIVENASSTGVKNCLNGAITGQSYQTQDRDGTTVDVKFQNGPLRAIGILSMDSLADSVKEDLTVTPAKGNWQFRALDGSGKITAPLATSLPVANQPDTSDAGTSTEGRGKLPTLAAIERGDWDLIGLVHFNIPNTTTGDKLSVLNNFVSIAQKPSILAATGALKFVAAAIPGGVNIGTQTLDAKFGLNNQCAPYSRNFND